MAEPEWNTMTMRSVPGMALLDRPRPLLAGVCAQIAERAGVPVWLPRALMLALLLLHGLVAIAIYVGLALVWREWRTTQVPPPPAREDPARRFRDLDARLAVLEREALWRETDPRRPFRPG